MISAGCPAVAANAAANAIVAVAPIAPSYWLPTTAPTLRARQRSRIRRDSVNPVRAVLMLTTRTAPSSSARSTCARLMQLSSPARGTGPALGQPEPPGAVLDRDRLLDRAHAQLGERVTGPDRVVIAPAAVGVDVEVGVRQRLADRARRRDVQRGRAPDLDLERGHAEPVIDLDRLLGHLRPARRTRPCARRRHRRRSAPSNVWHGAPRICPTRSHTARSTAPRAT